MKQFPAFPKADARIGLLGVAFDAFSSYQRGCALAGHFILNLPTPSHNAHAATKAYVDGTAIAHPSITQENVGAAIWFRTQAEYDAGVVPSYYGYPPGDVRRYGAVDDDSTDNKSAFQNAANTGLLIVPATSSKWALSSSVVLNGSCTIITYGRESTIRQTSWGVPVFEVRAAGISIPGHLYVEYTGSRTTFDGTALTNSNNTSTVKSEASGDPKAAGSAIYCRNTGDKLHIGHLDVYGFIAGILAASNDDVSIGQITADVVDFGTFGAPGRNWQIGSVNGINIDRTQGVDPHAVYFPGTGSAIGYGLQIGRVVCASVSDGAHVVSLQYQKNFTIGELVGHTDVGSALTVLECTGSVGIVEFTASKVPTNDDPSSCVLVQSNSNVTLDIARISCRQQTGTSNAGVNCTGGSTLNINHLDLTMADATAAKGVRSSGTARISSAIITYSSTQTEYALLAAAGGHLRVDTPVTNGDGDLVEGTTGGKNSKGRGEWNITGQQSRSNTK